MILSRKHNFVFIKGMKVAGTSIEMALSALCGPSDIVTPISPLDEVERLKAGGRCQNYSPDPVAESAYLTRLQNTPPSQLGNVRQPVALYVNHMPLAAVAKQFGPEVRNFRIVFAERSPYAKVISWANMRLTYGAYNAGGRMQANHDAIRTYIDSALKSGQLRDTLNIGRYRWEDGTLAGTPMRYENLHTEFAAFVRSLGIEDVPLLPHAKKGLLSSSLQPSSILRPDQITQVNEIFAEEFDAFGYDRV